MYTIVGLFYLSIIVMAAMLLLKKRELATNHPNIVSRIGAGTDHIFGAFFGLIKRSISYINKHTFIALAQWLAFHVLVHIRKLYVEIKHRALQNVHSRRVIDMVRGRGEIKKHGASFYLRRIGKDSSKETKLSK